MGTMMIRSKVKPDGIADVEAAVAKMFSAIEEARPNGVRYASVYRKQKARNDDRSRDWHT